MCSEGDFMRCLCCGAETPDLLCMNCRSEENFEATLLMLVKKDISKIDNVYFQDFAASVGEEYDREKYARKLLDLYNGNDLDFLTCRFYQRTDNLEFKSLAEKYLSEHEFATRKTQQILYDYLEKIKKDYEYAEQYVLGICDKPGVSIEVRLLCAECCAMFGNYSVADKLLNKAEEQCEIEDFYIFSNKEYMTARKEKLKKENDRYKSVKPYWPNSEDDRRRLVPLYEAKGIKYPQNY